MLARTRSLEPVADRERLHAVRCTPTNEDTMVNENSDSREEIQIGVVNVLQNMVEEWDLDLPEPIGPDTRIIEDLGFESIDLVQLVVSIEEKFGVRGLPYEKVLMKDGAYVTEIHLSDLVDFLHKYIPNLKSTETAAE